MLVLPIFFWSTPSPGGHHGKKRHEETGEEAGSWSDRARLESSDDRGGATDARQAGEEGGL